MKARLPLKLILAALGLLLLTGLGWLVVRHGPPAPIQVTAATATVTDLQAEAFGIGTVEAQRNYLIGPTAASRVKRIMAEVGDSVDAGQLLAEMDPVDLDERVMAARAAVNRAGHAVDAAAAQVRDSEARQRLAAANAERYASLGRQQFFSTAAVEAKQQEAVSAEAGSLSSRSALEAARQDLVRLTAEQAAAGKQKGNLMLRAPVAGVISARDAEPGTTLVAGQGVFRIVDPASIWVKTRIDQGRSGGLKPGLAATIVLRSRPQQSYPGKLVRLELLGDGVTEEKLVEVAFEQIPAGVSLNEMAEVTIALEQVPGALAIPNAAVRKSGGQEGVWLVEEGRIAYKAVRTGTRTLDGQVQVLSGLAKGEQVVVHSERELHAGDKVRVVAAQVKGEK